MGSAIQNIRTTGAIAESILENNSILTATVASTPIATTVAEQTLVGRITGGAIDDLSPATVRTLLNVADGANAYVHPTGDGNLHVPVTSTTHEGDVLTAGATAGSFAWASVSAASISNDAYAAGWNSVVDVAPSKNAIYDIMETKAPINNPTFTGTVSGTFSGNLTGTATSSATVTAASQPSITTLSNVTTLNGMSITSGNRQIVFNQTNGLISIKANAGAWATGLYCLGSSSTILCGVGGHGSADTLTYMWLGSAYNTPWLTLTSTAVTAKKAFVADLGITCTGALAATGTISTSGAITAAGNITAYYSDERLKDISGNIENALDKICSLNGFYYKANGTAQALGYEPVPEVGVSAQEVERVLPEAIAPAPVDGRYMTVRYDRLIPVLIEAIKELTKRVEELESRQ